MADPTPITPTRPDASEPRETIPVGESPFGDRRPPAVAASTGAAQMAAFDNPSAEPALAEADETPSPDDNPGADSRSKRVASFKDRAANPAMAPNEPPQPMPPEVADTAQTPIAPPAPSTATPPSPAAAEHAKPRAAATNSPQAQAQPDDPSAGSQRAVPATAPAILAAALTGGLRRPEPPRAWAPPPTSPDAQAPEREPLFQRLALKSLLDNLRLNQPRAAAPTARTPSAQRQTPTNAPAPAGGLRDKLNAFTAERMQPRRDAEQVKGAMQSGTAVLASLQALENRETAGILTKIRDAAKANGGMDAVISEMRPGGTFEDLRKQFNLALSHDEGFAAAYDKATRSLSAYAETRAGMIGAPRPRAPDLNLARLEALDEEIGAVAKNLPGLGDGKSALDDALDGGKEAFQKAFAAIKQAFGPGAKARGPSPSFGP